MSILNDLAAQAASALTSFGYTDPRTKQAVKAWQQMHGGLKLDGIYGTGSAAALAQDLVGGTAPKAYTKGTVSNNSLAALQAIAAKNKLVIKTAPKGTAASRGFVLKDAVLASFADWNSQFEGALPFMYTDIKGLVTTGIGNLIDPVARALVLPWENQDGSPSSQDQIAAAWRIVKGAWPKVQSNNCEHLTTIRLSKAGIQQLVESRLKSNDAFMASKFPGYHDWTADAQMASHSLGWAMGLGHLDPHTGDFKEWIRAMSQSPPDYRAASEAAHMNETGNPGLVPRNLANIVLFENAARILEGTGDPEVLYYLDPLPELLVS
jgi:hypothetical protein